MIWFFGKKDIMLIGILGTISDASITPVRGNGKTASMTYILKNMYADEEAEVFTNYRTNFANVFDTKDIGKMLNHLQEKKIYGLGIDEIQNFTNSYDQIHKKDLAFNILQIVQQSRHKNMDIFYTAQRFMDVHRRIRVQTDNYIIPKKYHLDGKRCFLDRCYKPHIIICSDVLNQYREFVFNIKDICDMYDTGEIIE